MRAVIIDDEKSARATLKKDLVMYCPGVEISAEADSVKTGIDIIRAVKPDLVFLDVELTDGNGFDILEQLKPVFFKVIFTTAFDIYAVKAFKFSALDYLLKPIDTAELVAAMKKMEFENKNMQSCLNVLLENVKDQQKQMKKIVVNATDGHYVFAIGEIVRFEAERNYTKIYFEGIKPLLVAKTLKYFEDLLKGQRFERVHQSHLVNLAHLKKYSNREGGYLVMSDGSNVPVAQRKKTELLALLESL